MPGDCRRSLTPVALPQAAQIFTRGIREPRTDDRFVAGAARTHPYRDRPAALRMVSS